jgi:hypothetical protein
MARLAVGPELELLLTCSRPQIDVITAARVQELAGQVPDWQAIVKISVDHGLDPLVYRRLNEICPAAVPDTALSQLKSAYQNTALHNLLYTKELLRILDLFTDHGIAALPYKGPALTTMLYGNVALRTFCDLDILVRPQDFFKAIGLLKRQGYRACHPLANAASERAYYSSDYPEYALIRDDGQVSIDLHWAIAPQYFQVSICFDSLWEHATLARLGDRLIPQMRVEDLLILLCVHGCKDSWRQLKWVCDVAQLLQAYPEICWKIVLTETQHLPSPRLVWIGLRLAQQLFGARLPESITRIVWQEQATSLLLNRILSRLLNPPRIVVWQTLQMRLRQVSDYYLLMPKFWQRIQFCSGYVIHILAPKPADFTWCILPLQLQSLYLFLRPARMFAKYCLPLIKGNKGPK